MPHPNEYLFRPTPIHTASDERRVSATSSPTARAWAALSREVREHITTLQGPRCFSKRATINSIQQEMAQLNIFTSQRGTILREISKLHTPYSVNSNELDQICQLILMHTVPKFYLEKNGKKDMPLQLQDLSPLSERELISREDRIALITNVIDFLGKVPKLTKSNYKNLKAVLVENIRAVGAQLTGGEKASLRDAFREAMSQHLQDKTYDPYIPNLQHHDDESLISELGESGAVLALAFNWLGTEKEPSPRSDGRAGEGQRYRHPDLRKYTLERNDEDMYTHKMQQDRFTLKVVTQYMTYRREANEQGNSSMQAESLQAQLAELMLDEEKPNAYKHAITYAEGRLAVRLTQKAHKEEQTLLEQKVNSSDLDELKHSLDENYKSYTRVFIPNHKEGYVASDLRQRIEKIQREMETKAKGAFAKTMRQIEGIDIPPQQTPVSNNMSSIKRDNEREDIPELADTSIAELPA